MSLVLLLDIPFGAYNPIELGPPGIAQQYGGVSLHRRWFSYQALCNENIFDLLDPNQRAHMPVTAIIDCICALGIREMNDLYARDITILHRSDSHPTPAIYIACRGNVGISYSL